VVNESRSVPYRTADYLTTPEDVQEYLNAALEDGNERVLLLALRNVADSLGGSEGLAARLGLAPQDLERALSEQTGPRFSSLVQILKAMGLELSVRQRRDAA
jgi:probable addiction module antidote protein